MGSIGDNGRRSMARATMSDSGGGGGLDKQAFMKVFADLKTFPKV